MIQGLGREEVEEILAERGDVEVACEFCVQYRFDPVDAAQLFTDSARLDPPVMICTNRQTAIG